MIAYSDGSDSRCVSKVSGNGSDAVCVRVTKHHHVPKAGDEPFDQIPFRVEVPSSRRSSLRSRGFKFAAVTAIAAHFTGDRIVVPESGQGALGRCSSRFTTSMPTIAIIRRSSGRWSDS